MPHFFHMNIENYGSGNVTLGPAGAIATRTAKQNAIRNLLTNYQAAQVAPVDIAGFTEVHAAPTTQARTFAGLADLGASLAIVGPPHVLISKCGISALGVHEYVGIVVRGDATVHGWGLCYESALGNGNVTELPAPAVVMPWRASRHVVPNFGIADRRCVVWVDATLPGGNRYRVGFIHNLYVLRDNLYVILSRLPAMLHHAHLDYVGGDLNAPPRNIRSRRQGSRMTVMAPPLATTRGGHIYDWWARSTAFPGGTAVDQTALNTAASDHTGVGLTF